LKRGYTLMKNGLMNKGVSEMENILKALAGLRKQKDENKKQVGRSECFMRNPRILHRHILGLLYILIP
jgi:hypothetical protein